MLNNNIVQPQREREREREQITQRKLLKCSQENTRF